MAYAVPLRFRRVRIVSCTSFVPLNRSRDNRIRSVRAHSQCLSFSRFWLPCADARPEPGTRDLPMPLCCCRRRRTNRVEEADTKTRNQETLHYIEDVKYYYWLARFGGNAAGHVIRGCAPPSTTGDILNSRAIFSSLLGGPWVAVAQNVDDDLAWTCPTNPAPEGFMERLREVAERG